jgi:hypothetical protein
MSDAVFYLAIIFAFCILPAAFLVGLQGAGAAIAAAPRLLERFGLRESPFAARSAMTALIFVPLTIFLPSLAIMAAVLAVLLLPLAILATLLAAIVCGFAARHGGFGDAFWRIARIVPFMCALFVVAAIPIAVQKYQTAQEIARSPSPRR